MARVRARNAKPQASRLPRPVRPRSTANALSLACLGLGFLAVLAAGRGDWKGGLSLLALAGLADTLAGRAAHGWQLESELGAELDGLASMLAWGVAAPVLAHAAGLARLGLVGDLAAGFAALAAAWRLCKGDVQQGRAWHEGLPLPAAGALLAAAAALQAPPLALAGLAVGLGLAQLLSLRYPRPAVPLALAAPLLLSLGLAGFGWVWGWALPGAAAIAWGLGGPFLRPRA